MIKHNWDEFITCSCGYVVHRHYSVRENRYVPHPIYLPREEDDFVAICPRCGEHSNWVERTARYVENQGKWWNPFDKGEGWWEFKDEINSLTKKDSL